MELYFFETERWVDIFLYGISEYFTTHCNRSLEDGIWTEVTSRALPEGAENSSFAMSSESYSEDHHAKLVHRPQPFIDPLLAFLNTRFWSRPQLIDSESSPRPVTEVMIVLRLPTALFEASHNVLLAGAGRDSSSSPRNVGSPLREQNTLSNRYIVYRLRRFVEATIQDSQSGLWCESSAEQINPELATSHANPGD